MPGDERLGSSLGRFWRNFEDRMRSEKVVSRIGALGFVVMVSTRGSKRRLGSDSTAIRRSGIALALMAALVLLSSCSSGASLPATGGSSTTSAASSTTSTVAPTSTTLAAVTHPHVFVIVMENLGYSAALSTPSIAALANRWAYASNYYATSHPSLPNYLSLIGGSTFGVTSDCVGCFVNAPNLAVELADKGISWSAYMEALPSDCYLAPYAPGGLYAGKHDPFVYFDAIRNSASLCAQIRPLGELTSQLGSSGQIPSFVWITPNLCNDGHNCAPQSAGAWLASMVSSITASSAWKDNGALYVTWDEGNGGDDSGLGASGQIQSSGGGGHVLTLVIEPRLAPGAVISAPLDHYSLLKSIEVNFGLAELGSSAQASLATLP